MSSRIKIFPVELEIRNLAEFQDFLAPKRGAKKLFFFSIEKISLALRISKICFWFIFATLIFQKKIRKNTFNAAKCLKPCRKVVPLTGKFLGYQHFPQKPPNIYFLTGFFLQSYMFPQ